MRVDESGLVQSVRARLLATATAAASDPNTVLARYGIERFLYRVSAGDRLPYVIIGRLTP